MKRLQLEQRPLVNSHETVDYAIKTSKGPSDWPRIIHVDNASMPLENGPGIGFIYVTRRPLDTSRSNNDEDIKVAKSLKKAAHKLGRQFIDYVIIGKDWFFSFNDGFATTHIMEEGR